MPTVPVIDQTAANPTPFAAPGVQPFRNDAPQQLEQFGQTLKQVGSVATQTGQTIGDRLAEQVDDAKVKSAEAKALSQAQAINYDPQNGFLNSRGQNTIDSYDDATKAVHKAFQDQNDALTNPIQKHMFQQVQNQHLLSIGQRMSDHNFQQTSQYSGEAAVSRATTFAQTASNSASSYGQVDAEGKETGDFAKNLKTAEQETLNSVSILKGAPADSDVAKEALLNLHTQIGSAAIQQMMDSRAPYSKVQQMYDDWKSKGYLTLSAQNTLGKMVKSYTEQESTRVAVMDGLSDAYRASQGKPTTSTGTPDYDFAIKGATITAQPYDSEQGNVNVPVAANSHIQAPADGKIVQAGKDENGDFAVGIQHMNGSVTTFTGLTAANVKVGDNVQRGEDVATSGKLQDSSSPSVVWSLADKNGQPLDPTRAGLGPVDITKITDEKVLSNALSSLSSKVTDPYLQQQARSEMESIVRHNQQMENVGKTELFTQASNAFYSAGENWRAIPSSLFNQLPPEKQQEFKDKQTDKVIRDYSQGQMFKTMSETSLVSDFYANPAMMTTANVEAARSQLSNSTYLSLMNRAEEQQKNPKGVIEATNIDDRIKLLAGPAGINISPKSDADKAKLNNLRVKVSDAVSLIKAENNGKATNEQVDKTIKGLIIQDTVNTPSILYKYTGLGSETNVTKGQYQYEKTPALGDSKTFPNGKTGVWDGHGWAAQP